MPLIHSVVRFAYDGTIAAAAPATPVIVPGVDAVWQCESEATDGNDVTLTDLTGARLIWVLTNSAGAILMWYEDAPFFTITDARHGLFTVTLAAGTTALLTPGTATLEIKVVFSDLTTGRVAATPLNILTTALAGQP